MEEELRKLHDGRKHVATGQLLEALTDCEVRGLDLLEVGGGIGTVTLDLMKNGVQSASFVEISPAFLNAAASRARRARVYKQIDFICADFVEIHSKVELADLVVMDRVLCCYPNAESLIIAALSRCRSLLGLTYPRDTLVSRVDSWIKNRRRRKAGNPFRTFVHSEELVRGLISEAGFDRRFSTTSPLWRIEVYERPIGT
ncbi:MAG: class I SAM-dependent methyltransferase [Rhodothermia bacterium]|nr:class I SAM-dependent methyltransferase [Rhodothermia bacterium]